MVLLTTVYAQSRLSIEGGAGVEFSWLEWNVAGNIQGSSPNVFSELKWANMFGSNYHLMASFDTGKISYFFQSTISPNINGEVEDTDYAGENRTNPQYREVFRSNAGRRFTSEAGVRFHLKVDLVDIIQIKTGIRYRNQRLFIDHEREDVQSYYDGSWSGIFVGFTKGLILSKFVAMGFSLNADLSYYYGFGNWKLRTELAHPRSFIHNAIGYGFNTDINTHLRLSKAISLIAALDGWYSNSFRGKDILYFNDGHSIITQLNGVKSLGSIASLGLSINF